MLQNGTLALSTVTLSYAWTDFLLLECLQNVPMKMHVRYYFILPPHFNDVILRSKLFHRTIYNVSYLHAYA